MIRPSGVVFTYRVQSDMGEARSPNICFDLSLSDHAKERWTMSQALAQRLAAALLLAVCAAPATATASPPPSGLPVVDQPRLEARTSVDGEVVTGTGRLLDAAGKPLAGKPISLLLDANQIGIEKTDSRGAFTVLGEVPAGTQPADHDVQLVFAGDDRLPGAVTSTRLRLGRLDAVRLSASASPAQAKAGGSVQVSGRLLDAAGKPISGVSVIAHDHLGDWTEMLETDKDGRFTGRLDIAPGAKPGKGSITVQFDADGPHAAGRTTTPFAVLPGGFTPAPAATAAGSIPVVPSPTTGSSPTNQTGAPSPTASGTATPRPAAGRSASALSGRGWALVGLATLGVLSSLLAMGRGLGEDDDDEVSLIAPGDEGPGDR